MYYGLVILPPSASSFGSLKIVTSLLCAENVRRGETSRKVVNYMLQHNTISQKKNFFGVENALFICCFLFPSCNQSGLSARTASLYRRRDRDPTFFHRSFFGVTAFPRTMLQCLNFCNPIRDLLIFSLLKRQRLATAATAVLALPRDDGHCTDSSLRRRTVIQGATTTRRCLHSFLWFGRKRRYRIGRRIRRHRRNHEGTIVVVVGLSLHHQLSRLCWGEDLRLTGGPVWLRPQLEVRTYAPVPRADTKVSRGINNRERLPAPSAPHDAPLQDG